MHTAYVLKEQYNRSNNGWPLGASGFVLLALRFFLAMWTSTKFSNFRSKYDKSIFFSPLFAKNAHFQLLLFANLDLNTFLPHLFCQLFQLSFRLIMQRQIGSASFFSLQKHTIWMRSRKVHRVV